MTTDRHRNLAVEGKTPKKKKKEENCFHGGEEEREKKRSWWCEMREKNN